MSKTLDNGRNLRILRRRVAAMWHGRLAQFSAHLIGSEARALTNANMDAPAAETRAAVAGEWWVVPGAPVPGGWCISTVASRRCMRRKLTLRWLPSASHPKRRRRMENNGNWAKSGLRSRRHTSIFGPRVAQSHLNDPQKLGEKFMDFKIPRLYPNSRLFRNIEHWFACYSDG